MDADHAMRLALIHDIPEALTGDRTPFDYLDDVSERRRLAANPAERSVSREADARATKHTSERDAMAHIMAQAPTIPARALVALWEEYAAESSPEAQLVHQLDKLEAYLQGLEYADDDRLAESHTLRSFRDDSGRMATVPSARALFKAIENWARAGAGLTPEDAIKPES
jgi:5'-deoxynucleotidase YfbR-like HD superfamily hydrolase